MIIEYRYDYWGDNGRCSESRLEEYESEIQAISDLGITAHHNAIEDTLKILRVIGGEDGAQERITSGVAGYVVVRVRKERIVKLQRDIASNELWFEQLDGEKERRAMSMYNQRVELIKLLALEEEQ